MAFPVMSKVDGVQRNGVEDGYSFPWFIAQSPPGADKPCVVDKFGTVVAEVDGGFLASRIVAACNATSRFEVSELRDRQLVGNLLSRIIKLQNLTLKLLYDEQHKCRLCGEYSDSTHLASFECALLNPKEVRANNASHDK